jgi:hypothetical protein
MHMSILREPPPITSPRVYTTSIGWKVFAAIVGVPMALGGLVAIWAIHADPTISPGGALALDALSLAMSALGGFTVVGMFRYRVTLTRNGIEQRDVFGSRTLRNEEIGSRRTVNVGNGVSVVELAPRDATAKPLRVSRMLKTDHAFARWLDAFPDQAVLDAQRVAADVRADPAYGDDPDERLRSFARLGRATRSLGVAATAICFWGMVFPHPYRLVLALLALCPLLGLAIVATSGGRIRIDQKARDPRPSVVFLLMPSGLLLAVRAFLDVSLLDWRPALLAAVAGGVVLTLAAMAADAQQRRWQAALLLFVMMGLPWSYGVAVALDVQLDRTTEHLFATKVLRSSASGGSHPDWNLELAPWGPVRNGGEESVDRALYDATAVGDTVCVSLNDGAFGWRWYWVEACPAR